MLRQFFNAMGVLIMKYKNLKARNDILLKRIVDETLVYDPVSEHIHVITRLSTAVWELLDGSKNTDTIISILKPEFELKSKNLPTEVQSAIQFFLDKAC